MKIESNSLHPSDWRVAERDFARIFADVAVGGSKWRLDGRNFITPERLGFVRDPDGELVEISTGLGMRYDRLFGVTWNRRNDDSPDERDNVFTSLQDAYDHIFG